MKQILALSVLFILPGVVFAQLNQTDSISITTYYPSPYGVYRNLRLFPSQQPAASSAQQNGTMYYNQSTNMVYFYNGASWLPFGGGGTGWALNGTKLYNTNSGNVGIGTDNPTAALEINGAVKVGMATTCDAATAGSIRFNPAGSGTLQYCADGSWVDSSRPAPNIVGGAHTEADCVAAGGTVVASDVTFKQCRFNSACPTGWTQYKSFGTYTANTCANYNCYPFPGANPVPNAAAAGSSWGNYWAVSPCNCCTKNPGIGTGWSAYSCPCAATVVQMGCY